MARKKQKQANISQETLERARREAAGEIIASSTAPAAQPVKSGKVEAAQVQKTTIEDLEQEYSYVMIDLRSMAILAGVEALCGRRPQPGCRRAVEPSRSCANIRPARAGPAERRSRPSRGVRGPAPRWVHGQ